MVPIMPNIAVATDFMATHARLLDRRRFDVLVHGGAPEAVLAAVEAFRNPDGGYGWGIEPDLRAAASQPAGAYHAMEAWEDVLPLQAPRAGELCGWLAGATLPDGGLPFALPVESAAGCAPFWAGADASASSLQITSLVAGAAYRLGLVSPWLDRATEFCLRAIDGLGDDPHAIELAFAVRFLDAVGDEGRLGRIGAHIPADGIVRVQGGLEDEVMRPLDFAPMPGPARALFPPGVIEADLERLAGGQLQDGGWAVDFASYSPAAALEWRGHVTVRNLAILRRNGLA
jgi:hypothetical protein